MREKGEVNEDSYMHAIHLGGEGLVILLLYLCPHLSLHKSHVMTLIMHSPTGIQTQKGFFLQEKKTHTNK